MRGAACCLSVIVSSWEAQTCVHAKANFRRPAIEFLRQPSGPQRRGTDLGCGTVHASAALPIERTRDVEVCFQPRPTAVPPTGIEPVHAV
jgi:hypothetical protein